MGTRAQVAVFDGVDKLVQIYVQFDGYPAGLGADLARFINGVTLSEGVFYDDTRPCANGVGCFAAQLVQHLKSKQSRTKIEPPTQPLLKQEYAYMIGGETNRPERGFTIAVYHNDVQVFLGNPAGLLAFCTRPAPQTYEIPM